ncbi:hypothetical protein DY000_02039591 [Brassica cretica]|uniref:Uncharacterized protein n=1 Tax=Brassica cretica TaxID=69181 RepID=A0ABQ7BIS6_BRACR|nr:hypothetical protein DY000_02039591 [Brassica cretica]
MLETKLSYGRGDGDEACCDGKGTSSDLPNKHINLTDEYIQPELEPDLTEPDIQDMISNITKPETVQDVPLAPVPTVFKGVITRQRAKVLQYKFNESMILASDLGQVEDSSLKKDELKSELAEKNQASSLHALREEMRVMRQDLGDKMTRVEQRPPLQAVRNVDRILNPNLDNRGEGVCINDDQRTGDDTGQQHGPNPNQRARIQHDDYGEEYEEDEDFLPRPRAPRWQNRKQGIVRQTALRISNPCSFLHAYSLSSFIFSRPEMTLNRLD